MTARALHRVSCKAILFNEDYSRVLITNLGVIGFGLPGGHIDQGETPDQAMQRELMEEVGLKDVSLQHHDFSSHRDGKVVLYYVGMIRQDTQLTPQYEEVDSLEWALVEDVMAGRFSLPTYDEMIGSAWRRFSVDV